MNRPEITRDRGQAVADKVRSRLVLNFPGFEQTSPEKQLDRIRHSAQKTGNIWHFDFERQSVSREPGANHALSECVTTGKGWEVRTRIVQFSWNDIIQAYERETHPWAFTRNLPKFLAFFTDGTVGRYRRASGRYWAFTIFPILLLAIFIALSGFLAGLGAAWMGLTGAAHVAATMIGALLLTLILCKWPGDRLYLLLTINDWGFARDMVNRSNPAIEDRYREFANTILTEVRRCKADEIVISGHSFGSLWAVAALAIALEKEPELLSGKNCAFLALGSSLLKIALAKRAGFMRDWTTRVAADPNIFWHEIQTKDDIIAFYKCDPFEVLGIPQPVGGYRIDRVNYKKAMDRKRYRSMRRSFYRTHRQYILYQDKPAPYDYMLRLFGPVSARSLATDPQAVSAIDPAVKLV